MRKLRMTIFMALLVLYGALAYSIETCRISTTATTSGIVYTGRSYFYGMLLKTDGTNAVTLNIYDGTAVSTKRLVPTGLVIPGTDFYFGYKPPLPIMCQTGIYVTVSVAGGGTCSYQVMYNVAH